MRRYTGHEKESRFGRRPPGHSKHIRQRNALTECEKFPSTARLLTPIYTSTAGTNTGSPGYYSLHYSIDMMNTTVVIPTWKWGKVEKASSLDLAENMKDVINQSKAHGDGTKMGRENSIEFSWEQRSANKEGKVRSTIGLYRFFTFEYHGARERLSWDRPAQEHQMSKFSK